MKSQRGGTRHSAEAPPLILFNQVFMRLTKQSLANRELDLFSQAVDARRDSRFRQAVFLAERVYGEAILEVIDIQFRFRAVKLLQDMMSHLVHV